MIAAAKRLNVFVETAGDRDLVFRLAQYSATFAVLVAQSIGYSSQLILFLHKFVPQLSLARMIYRCFLVPRYIEDIFNSLSLSVGLDFCLSFAGATALLTYALLEQAYWLNLAGCIEKVTFVDVALEIDRFWFIGLFFYAVNDWRRFRRATASTREAYAAKHDFVRNGLDVFIPLGNSFMGRPILASFFGVLSTIWSINFAWPWSRTDNRKQFLTTMKE